MQRIILVYAASATNRNPLKLYLQLYIENNRGLFCARLSCRSMWVTQTLCKHDTLNLQCRPSLYHRFLRRSVCKVPQSQLVQFYNTGRIPVGLDAAIFVCFRCPCDSELYVFRRWQKCLVTLTNDNSVGIVYLIVVIHTQFPFNVHSVQSNDVK